MDTEQIFFKTEKGKDEIERRSCGLPFRQRRVLILVDGRSTVAELQAKSAGTPDFVETLEELQRLGLVCGAGDAPPAAEPVGAADAAPRNGGTVGCRERLIGLAGEILGPEAAKVIRKLREAPDSAEGLASSLESCRKMVRLTIDEGKAEELYRRGQALLP